MTIEEIKEKVKSIEGIGRMTVNERLYVSELMKTFEKSQKKDKELAKSILSELKIDEKPIMKIVSKQ